MNITRERSNKEKDRGIQINKEKEQNICCTRFAIVQHDVMGDEKEKKGNINTETEREERT